MIPRGTGGGAMCGSLLNGMGYSGGSWYYDSFNQNIEHLGSVGPNPLFAMPPFRIPIPPLSWENAFSVTEKPTPAQFSTYDHRTRFIVKRKRVRIEVYVYIGIFFVNHFFFHVKNIKIWNKSLNMIVLFIRIP